jgi:hypothetical protein
VTNVYLERSKPVKATKVPRNYRLPPDVAKAVLARAKRDRVTETDVVEAALRVYLGVFPSWVPKKGGDHAAH